MKCKRKGCDKNLANPRAKYCGDACRMAHVRSMKTLPEQSDPNTRSPEQVDTRIASLDDYHTNPKDYALRACAELLNWGPWMSASDLAKARLSANREIVPGDWDYEQDN